MKKSLAAAALALALAAPAGALAQSPYLGLRFGLGFPYGTAGAVGGTSVGHDDLIKSVVPLQGDVGFRLGPIDLAGYFSYGFARPASGCEGSCSANVLRMGFQAILHSPLAREREVWAGILAGWERTKLDGGTSADLTASGWEGGFQGGYDFTNSTAGFGPYVQVTMGQYDTIERGGVSTTSFDKKYHGTFTFGVRGFFGI